MCCFNEKSSCPPNRWSRPTAAPLLALSALLTLIVLAGCVTPSLYTPRPLERGEVQLGAYATLMLPPHVLGEDEEGDSSDDADEPLPFVPWPSGSFRVGLGGRWEAGVTAGLLGVYGTMKRGFMPYESPLQVSVLGGAGLWGPIVELGTGYPSLDLGFLAGYDLIDGLHLYGGYRQYVIGTFFTDADHVVYMSNLIAGLELFSGSIISIPIEINYTISRGLGEIFDTPYVTPLVGWPLVNAGITFTF